MLDVFVAALIIFMLKSGSFTTAVTAPALYPFIAAVLLTAYLVQRKGFGSSLWALM